MNLETAETFRKGLAKIEDTMWQCKGIWNSAILQSICIKKKKL